MSASREPAESMGGHGAECPLTHKLVIFIQIYMNRQPQKAGGTGDVW